MKHTYVRMPRFLILASFMALVLSLVLSACGDSPTATSAPKPTTAPATTAAPTTVATTAAPTTAAPTTVATTAAPTTVATTAAPTTAAATTAATSGGIATNPVTDIPNTIQLNLPADVTKAFTTGLPTGQNVQLFTYASKDEIETFSKNLDGVLTKAGAKSAVPGGAGLVDFTPGTKLGGYSFGNGAEALVIVADITKFDEAFKGSSLTADQLKQLKDATQGQKTFSVIAIGLNLLSAAGLGGPSTTTAATTAVATTAAPTTAAATTAASGGVTTNPVSDIPNTTQINLPADITKSITTGLPANQNVQLFTYASKDEIETFSKNLDGVLTKAGAKSAIPGSGGLVDFTPGTKLGGYSFGNGAEALVIVADITKDDAFKGSSLTPDQLKQLKDATQGQKTFSVVIIGLNLLSASGLGGSGTPSATTAAATTAAAGSFKLLDYPGGTEVPATAKLSDAVKVAPVKNATVRVFKTKDDVKKAQEAIDQLYPLKDGWSGSWGTGSSPDTITGEITKGNLGIRYVVTSDKKEAATMDFTLAEGETLVAIIAGEKA